MQPPLPKSFLQKTVIPLNEQDINRECFLAFGESFFGAKIRHNLFRSRVYALLNDIASAISDDSALWNKFVNSVSAEQFICSVAYEDRFNQLLEYFNERIT